MKNNLKVAFVVGDFPALSETFVLNQVTGLIDRGYSVDIIAYRTRDEKIKHPDISRYQLMEQVSYLAPSPSYLRRILAVPATLFKSRNNIWPLLKALDFIRYGRESLSLRLFFFASRCLVLPQYDVLLCHGGQYGLRALALRETGALAGKIVTFFHGADISSYLVGKGEGAYQHLFENGELFLPISEYWRSRLKALGCPVDKTQIHRMGIDPGKFTFAKRAWNGQGPLRLVSVARLVEKKGLEFAIRAVSQLVEKGYAIDYRIAGDGPLRDKLQTLIDQLNVHISVKLIGAKGQDEVATLLADSQVLLAPSVTTAAGDKEGIPVAIMEAMAMGLVVISSVHSGIPELIEDNHSGLLAEERDVDGIAGKIKQLFSRPTDFGTLAANGHASVLNKHHIDRLNDNLALKIIGL